SREVYGNHTGHQPCGQGFRHAGNAFNEDVSVSQDSRNKQRDHFVLPDDDLPDFVPDLVDTIAKRGKVYSCFKCVVFHWGKDMVKLGVVVRSFDLFQRLIEGFELIRSSVISRLNLPHLRKSAANNRDRYPAAAEDAAHTRFVQSLRVEPIFCAAMLQEIRDALLSDVRVVGVLKIEVADGRYKLHARVS